MQEQVFPEHAVRRIGPDQQTVQVTVELFAAFGPGRRGRHAQGARPLRRVIQQKVEDKLSDLVLAGEFGPGSSILVDVDEDEEIVLSSKEEKKKEKEAAPAA